MGTLYESVRYFNIYLRYVVIQCRKGLEMSGLEICVLIIKVGCVYSDFTSDDSMLLKLLGN